MEELKERIASLKADKGRKQFIEKNAGLLRSLYQTICAYAKNICLRPIFHLQDMYHQ